MSAFKTSLAALGATAALALAPGASAQSYDYNDCKRSDKDAQVVGGLVGGLLGAVAGHEIAGRGETTEGAVVGAIAGAAAGAAIGDDRRNCSEEVYGVREADLRRARTGDAVRYDAHYRNGYHRHDRRDRRYDRRRDRYDYGYGGFRDHREVRAQIERLKDEDRRLKRRAKYRWEPWIERRRDELRWEIKRLKRIEDRLEDRYKRRRDYRDDRWDDRRDYRRDRRGYRDYDFGRRHYHGSTVCYADH